MRRLARPLRAARPRGSVGRGLAVAVAAVVFGLQVPAVSVLAQEAAPEPDSAAVPAPPPEAAPEQSTAASSAPPSEVASPLGSSSAEFARRVEEALAAAEAALNEEAARLDELAGQASTRGLPDGTPSAGQAAANARLWAGRIREAEARSQELRKELAGSLEALAPHIAALAKRLSAAMSSPAEVERSLALTREERASIQRALRESGIDAGAVDGVFGPRTRTAILAWQRAGQRAGTGYLTREEADALIAAWMAAAPAAREPEPSEKRESRQSDSARSPSRVFRDCAGCPEMVTLPPGEFLMGSPESESGREEDEGPVHRVAIGYRFAVGVHEVTRREFGRFLSETDHRAGGSCWTFENGKWKNRYGVNWEEPGFHQAEDHPAVCVNWEDARAYTRWLSAKTGKAYRLLSEAEWEYAARAGTQTPRYWGADRADQCRYANGPGTETSLEWRNTSCDDAHEYTAPVGNFGANKWGLHDMLGNVWEWTQDCWSGDYRNMPSDGAAQDRAVCAGRVQRGGSWDTDPAQLRAARRIYTTQEVRMFSAGFRIARTLP